MRHPATTFLALLMGALILPGCATIFTGTSDTIRFESEPSGAQILIDGIERGRTPASIPVSRSAFNDKQVTLQLDGYADRTFVLDKNFNAVSILNVLTGPLLVAGFAVDLATGAVMEYDSEAYSMTLDPDQALNMDALPRDADGRYLLPPTDADAVAVKDAESGVTVIFER